MNATAWLNRCARRGVDDTIDPTQSTTGFGRCRLRVALGCGGAWDESSQHDADDRDAWCDESLAEAAILAFSVEFCSLASDLVPPHTPLAERTSVSSL
jgi:hypothetical protein